MIYGLGLDAVAMDRMKKSMEKPRFAQWVFDEREREMLQKHTSDSKRLESAAANFAAKEAFLKAAGVGLGAFALHDIAALRAESGQPYYELSGEAAAFCEANGLKAHLSLSHEGGMALAVAMLEKV